MTFLGRLPSLSFPTCPAGTFPSAGLFVFDDPSSLMPISAIGLSRFDIVR